MSRPVAIPLGTTAGEAGRSGQRRGVSGSARWGGRRGGARTAAHRPHATACWVLRRERLRTLLEVVLPGREVLAPPPVRGPRRQHGLCNQVLAEKLEARHQEGGCGGGRRRGGGAPASMRGSRRRASSGSGLPAAGRARTWKGALAKEAVLLPQQLLVPQAQRRPQKVPAAGGAQGVRSAAATRVSVQSRGGTPHQRRMRPRFLSAAFITGPCHHFSPTINVGRWPLPSSASSPPRASPPSSSMGCTSAAAACPLLSAFMLVGGAAAPRP